MNKLFVEAVGLVEELVMVADLNELTFVENENSVGLFDGREPMSDEKDGVTSQVAVDGFLNQMLRFGV